jgi:hypothetical protein
LKSLQQAVKEKQTTTVSEPLFLTVLNRKTKTETRENLSSWYRSRAFHLSSGRVDALSLTRDKV